MLKSLVGQLRAKQTGCYVDMQDLRALLARMLTALIRGSTHTSRKVVGSCAIRYPRVDGCGADLPKGGRSVSGGPLRAGYRVLCLTVRYAAAHKNVEAVK